jgi:hypothetical protein
MQLFVKNTPKSFRCYASDADSLKYPLLKVEFFKVLYVFAPVETVYLMGINWKDTS